MKPTNPHILTVNGGSSSSKFALFEANPILRRILAGTIERIGPPEAVFSVRGLSRADNLTRSVTTNRVRCQILQTVGLNLSLPTYNQSYS
jgi:acetate kinase